MGSPLPTAAGLAYREAVPDGPVAGTLLCLHGYPESSWMWRAVLDAAAAAGWRALAPDLPGYGDSEPDPPATWTRMVEAVDRFHAALDLGPVALCVHDWGGLIGLRWACEHPDAVRALVISDSGFFPDGKWHGMAQVMRTPGDGEAAIAQFTEEGFAGLMRSVSPEIEDAAIREYWKGFDGEARRAGHLELYRSGEFSELERYDGVLAGLGVPTMLLWGADDAFAPVAGAHRFAREIPHAELEILDGVGHFVFDDVPDQAAGRVVRFLATLGRDA